MKSPSAKERSAPMDLAEVRKVCDEADLGVAPAIVRAMADEIEALREVAYAARAVDNDFALGGAPTLATYKALRDAIKKAGL